MASILDRSSEERAIIAVSDEPEQAAAEQQAFLEHPQSSSPRWLGKPGVPVFNKVMAVINFLLLIVLATSLGLVAHSNTKACPESVAEVIDPYCK